MKEKNKKGYYRIFAIYNPDSKKLAFSLHWKKRNNSTWSHVCDSVYIDISSPKKALTRLLKFIRKNVYKRYRVKVILISGFPSNIIPHGIVDDRVVFISYYNETHYNRLLELSKELVGSRRRN